MLYRVATAPRRRAIAAVEFALLSIPLFFILVGMWECSRLVEILQVLQNAVREGARVAAAGRNTASDGTTDELGTPHTTVLNYIGAAGFSTASLAVTSSTGADASTSPAALTLTNLTLSTRNYQNANQMDHFRMSITYPIRNSRLLFLPKMMDNNATIASSADWYSLRDTPITIDTALPQN